LGIAAADGDFVAAPIAAESPRTSYNGLVTNSTELPVVAPIGRIGSLLIKPASALCNLDCAYCFYLDRASDPYGAQSYRRMSLETLDRLVKTWLAYSYPNSTFAFQGGEPTLCGPDFFARLCELQKQHGRNGQYVSNALQTNAVLIDEHWCEIFREYDFLLGVSIDGPEPIHDLYRLNKGGQGTWKQVMRSIELLQKRRVDFNALCVVSTANVERPKELYKFYKSLGIDYIQFIPLAEFDPDGRPLPFTPSPEQYGRFLCDMFDLWWPDMRRIRIRFFDNLAEAIAGQKPGACTMHESCDSYVVVEYNGDVYPCDFFVEREWKLGNICQDTWIDIAREQQRHHFAAKKSAPNPECAECEYKPLCHNGCPHLRRGRNGRFEDLDYYCASYKMLLDKNVGKLTKEVEKLLRRR
jgi:uncharacterized protein